MKPDRASRWLCTLGAVLLASATLGDGVADHPPHDAAAAPPRFVASTAKPFDALMHDAMAVMNHDMATASMTGDVEHDFIAMMIPHHQGAVDMAKAVLLHTRDPEIVNLAQGIIAEQETEIRIMEAWRARHRRAAPAR